jgi:hypothetical protein
MNIDVNQVLNPHDTFLIRKYLEKRCPRLATLVLFLACRKAYPGIDPNRLYKVCWHKIRTKIEPNKPV